MPSALPVLAVALAAAGSGVNAFPSNVSWNMDRYGCIICDTLVEAMMSGEAFRAACDRLDVCTSFPGGLGQLTESFIKRTLASAQTEWATASTRDRDVMTRKVCSAMRLCPASLSTTAAESNGTPDFRVTPVLGANGYEYVRVSLISNASNTTQPATNPPSLFTYEQQFRYRWTDKMLRSGLVKVTPGQPSSFEIDGTSFEVLLPEEGTGVRGVIIADPCFDGSFVGCTYGDKLQTFDRITGFINAASAKPRDQGGIDFWMILGDNFYDREGQITTRFFNAISAQAKAKLFAAAPGNHDFWVGGSPLISVKGKDQFANGFMQYYAMDTLASKADSVNFIDFSNDPSKGGPSEAKDNLPKQENFQTYFKIGNLGFISYGGLYTYKEQEPFLTEACAWLGNQTDVANAFLVGHWNDGGLGCAPDMDVPNAHKKLKTLPGCQEYGDKLKYYAGHTHCNRVIETGVGFMVAGMGMEGCGNFGVPVVDSTGDTPQILYFPIQDVHNETVDMYNATVQCFLDKGVGGCTDMATNWA